MPKTRSLVKQVQDVLQSKLCIGESKYLAKREGTAINGIYSWSTYRTYLQQSVAFAKWVKSTHGCRSLDEARQHVNEYIKGKIDQGYSPFTQKVIASALGKVYGCSSTDFIQTNARYRASIVRSRQGKAIFSEEKNREFVDFCKATGLRRSEIQRLKPDQLRYDETTRQYSLEIKGKGGKVRIVPILSQEAVARISSTPTGQLVWNVPTRADIHSYRAVYCQSIYYKHARSLADIPEQDRYRCRKDLRGVIYDKRAMLIASQALGHNRIDVIAAHYL